MTWDQTDETKEVFSINADRGSGNGQVNIDSKLSVGGTVTATEYFGKFKGTIDASSTQVTIGSGNDKFEIKNTTTEQTISNNAADRLNTVQFISKSSSNSSNYGKMEFYVDSANNSLDNKRLTIDDSGIDVAGTIQHLVMSALMQVN